jgi:hypothetical protein
MIRLNVAGQPGTIPLGGDGLGKKLGDSSRLGWQMLDNKKKSPKGRAYAVIMPIIPTQQVRDGSRASRNRLETFGPFPNRAVAVSRETGRHPYA